MSRRSVYERIEGFRNGRTSVKQEEITVLTSTSFADKKTERVRDMVLQHARLDTDEMVNQLKISPLRS